MNDSRRKSRNERLPSLPTSTIETYPLQTPNTPVQSLDDPPITQNAPLENNYVTPETENLRAAPEIENNNVANPTYESIDNYHTPAECVYLEVLP